MARLKSDLVLIGGAGLVVALDQWSKYLVRSSLAYGEVWVPWDWLGPYARIVHWNNTGAAFGIFPAAGSVIAVVSVLVVVAILYYFPQVPPEQRLVRVALVLQFGGAIGNLVDRISQGTVTDFASVGSFPVFNVADACISIGVALLVAALWVEERKRKALPPEALPAGIPLPQEDDTPG
ncbi:MAG: signal peptidase II [Anaerolineales bacterium]|nr:signal peptidase II [Anaerolineales bacterium]